MKNSSIGVTGILLHRPTFPTQPPPLTDPLRPLADFPSPSSAVTARGSCRLRHVYATAHKTAAREQKKAVGDVAMAFCEGVVRCLRGVSPSLSGPCRAGAPIWFVG